MEGYVSNNVLVARVVLLNAGSQQASSSKTDDADFRMPRDGNGALTAWQRYRSRGNH